MIVILIRTLQQTWLPYGTAKSYKEADQIWKKRIQGRGVTAWSEMVTGTQWKRMQAGMTLDEAQAIDKKRKK